MINTGLRAYLWDRKPEEEKVVRELWECNGAGYQAYRAFLQHVKDHGWPSPEVDRLARGPSESAEPSEGSTSAARSRSSRLSQRAPQYAFSGMAHLFDEGPAAATVLAWGRLSSALLAWGAADGAIRLARLDAEPCTPQVLRGHTGAVRDLDFSQQNDSLLSAAEDGTVRLWALPSGALLRAMERGAPVLCGRFHPVNQTLLLAGGAGGAVAVLNASIGSTLAEVRLPGGSRRNPLEVTALAVSPTCVYAGDTRGCIHTLRCDIRDGALQRCAVVASTQPLGARSLSGAQGLVRLQHAPFCHLAKGPALLAVSASGALTLLRIPPRRLQLEVVAAVVAPPAARPLRGALCPLGTGAEGEAVALGGEDTAVHVYDLARGGPGPAVLVSLQGHGAPVVDVGWSFDERLMASCDCNGLVIVWKRDKPGAP